MKILFIKLGELGGVLRTIPLFLGLKEKYPSCELWFLTKRDAVDLVSRDASLDRLCIWEQDKEMLKHEKFDWIINTEDDRETCNFVSNLISRKITGPYEDQSKNKTYSKDSALWYDMGKISKFGIERANELKKKSERSYQEIYCDILGLPRNDYPLRIKITPFESKESNNFRIKKGIKNGEILVGVNTGAGKNWPLKSISVDKTVELIGSLEQKGFKVVLLGGPNEQERNVQIRSKVKNSIIDSGVNNNLNEFIAIINALDILVTSDTLALHLGIALGKRIVSFFGPTSAEEIDMHNQGIKIKPNSDCYCCFQKNRIKDKMCIDYIKVEDLVKEVLKQKELL